MTTTYAHEDVWKNTDPRHSINKRAEIVIIRPGAGGRETCLGYVDTKDGWYIHTTFEGHTSIHADDKWDTDWCWTWAPAR